jgi:hypothetical protein
VFGLTGALAMAGWLVAALLIVMLFDARDAPEGTTGLAVAVLMPPVLALAFGFTSVAAAVWHRYGGGRVSLVVSIGSALAAVLGPAGWMAAVDVPFSVVWRGGGRPFAIFRPRLPTSTITPCRSTTGWPGSAEGLSSRPP